jgi:hypothetical protein
MRVRPLRASDRHGVSSPARRHPLSGSLVCPALAGLGVALGFCVAASADPLPGEIIKFDNEPMLATPIGGAIFNGHDERSNAYQQSTNPQLFQGQFMADDFSDKFSTPVVHLSWWGSYMNPNSPHAPAFLISFESDVPGNASTGTASTPGTPLLNQVVVPGAIAPGSGTFTEAAVGADIPDGTIYKYNAELSVPFAEQPNTVYWLKIAALWPVTAPTTAIWGWHNRDYTIQDLLAAGPPVPSPGEFSKPGPIAGSTVWHFQDDAVLGSMTLINPNANPFAPGPIPPPDLAQSQFAPTSYVDGFDGPTGISSFSKDLAFQLYTVPEPGPVALLGGAMATMLLRRGRRSASHRLS